MIVLYQNTVEKTIPVVCAASHPDRVFSITEQGSSFSYQEFRLCASHRFHKLTGEGAIRSPLQDIECHPLTRKNHPCFTRYLCKHVAFRILPPSGKKVLKAASGSSIWKTSRTKGIPASTKFLSQQSAPGKVLFGYEKRGGDITMPDILFDCGFKHLDYSEGISILIDPLTSDKLLAISH